MAAFVKSMEKAGLCTESHFKAELTAATEALEHSGATIAEAMFYKASKASTMETKKQVARQYMSGLRQEFGLTRGKEIVHPSLYKIAQEILGSTSATTSSDASAAIQDQT